MLCTTHTPNYGARTIVSHCPRHTLQLLAWGTCYTFNFLWIPLAHFFLDLIHAPNTGTDKLFIFPTVFEDMPQNTPNQRNIRTRPEANILISMSRRTRETWVANNNWCVVLLFCFQQMKQGHRVCLSRISTNNEDCFGVVDIIIAISHGAVAPCVCYTCHSR